ncbi:hypothetical protein ACJX0J_041670, partial [Zea mays]
WSTVPFLSSSKFDDGDLPVASFVFLGERKEREQGIYISKYSMKSQTKKLIDQKNVGRFSSGFPMKNFIFIVRKEVGPDHGHQFLNILQPLVTMFSTVLIQITNSIHFLVQERTGSLSFHRDRARTIIVRLRYVLSGLILFRMYISNHWSGHAA